MASSDIEFALLRESYYTAGRLSFFNGQFVPGATLLGYALEFSLKASVVGIPMKDLPGDVKKQINRHDLPALVEALTTAQLLPSLDVSAEFWEFASDRLNQRYPRQQRAVRDRQKSLGRVGVISVGDVQYYDDAMMQLDDALVGWRGPLVSLVERASRSLDISSTGYQLHCNAHALTRLAARPELADVVDRFWRSRNLPLAIHGNYDPNLAMHVAACFTYPVPLVNEAPTGTVTRIPLVTTPVSIRATAATVLPTVKK